MVAGTLALAGLLWVAGQTPVDLAPIDQRNFKLPIHVDPGRRPDMKELVLVVSEDQGKTWKEQAVVNPDQESFTYFAPADGVYWFNMYIVYGGDRRDPPDVTRVPPRQKILVDTVKPILRIISADRQGNDVSVAWDIQEEHLDPASLKLEYRTADSSNWMSAALTQASNGKTSFRVDNPGPVSIRMQVQDTASNQATSQSEIPGAGGLPSLGSSPVPPLSVPVPSPSVLQASASAPPWEKSRYGQMPPAAPIEMRTLPRPLPQPEAPALVVRPVTSPGDPGARSIASTTPAQPVPAAAGYAAPPTRTSASAPNVVNTTRLNLGYNVKNVGPSGVGETELYVTQDNGQSWQPIAPIKDPTGNNNALTVNVPGQGVFGFTLIVRSKAGLGKRPPQPGDLPQMIVEVDTTAPDATLFEPVPIPGRTDAVYLDWSAQDRNLTARPITLEWTDKPGGLWKSIVNDNQNGVGDGVKTTGRYLWQLPPQMPDKVFLRLVVKDSAGNTGIAETREPILVDLSEPDASLTGLATPASQPEPSRPRPRTIRDPFPTSNLRSASASFTVAI